MREELHKMSVATRERLAEYQNARRDADWVRECASVLSIVRRAFGKPSIYLSPAEATIYVSINLESFTDKKFVRALARIDAALPFTKTLDYPAYSNRDYVGERKVGERTLKVTISCWLKNADDESKNCRRVLKDVKYERVPVYEFVCA
jgi:hypothetical protein